MGKQNSLGPWVLNNILLNIPIMQLSSAGGKADRLEFQSAL